MIGAFDFYFRQSPTRILFNSNDSTEIGMNRHHQVRLLGLWRGVRLGIGTMILLVLGCKPYNKQDDGQDTSLASTKAPLPSPLTGQIVVSYFHHGDSMLFFSEPSTLPLAEQSARDACTLYNNKQYQYKGTEEPANLCSRYGEYRVQFAPKMDEGAMTQTYVKVSCRKSGAPGISPVFTGKALNVRDAYGQAVQQSVISGWQCGPRSPGIKIEIAKE